jgi:hypothetical protein
MVMHFYAVCMTKGVVLVDQCDKGKTLQTAAERLRALQTAITEPRLYILILRGVWGHAAWGSWKNS